MSRNVLSLLALATAGAVLSLAGAAPAAAEVFVAKLRLFRVPEMLAGSFALAFVDLDFDFDFFLPFSEATAPPMMAPTISPATTSPLSARAGFGAMGENGVREREAITAPLARDLNFIASLRNSVERFEILPHVNTAFADRKTGIPNTA